MLLLLLLAGVAWSAICTNVGLKEHCIRNKECEWVVKKPCRNHICYEFFYNCRQVGFCAFNQGEEWQRESQCLETPGCTWNKNKQCTSSTMKPTASPTMSTMEPTDSPSLAPVEYEEYEYEYER